MARDDLRPDGTVGFTGAIEIEGSLFARDVTAAGVLRIRYSKPTARAIRQLRSLRLSVGAGALLLLFTCSS